MNANSVSIHIFRRDLRLHDNSALLAALEKSQLVVPIFIFDERQLDNPFRGDFAFRFLLNSLRELDLELQDRGSHLYLFRGIAEDVLEELLGLLPVSAVYLNRDYTPFSLRRDAAMKEVCASKNIEIQIYADALLTEPEWVHKDDGLPYTVFTPFMKRASKMAIAKPVANDFQNFYNAPISGENPQLPDLLMPKTDSTPLLQGGRNEGLKLLEQVGTMDNYNEVRNIPALNATSLLSAHHKFGTISVRETFERARNLDESNAFVSELYWRDFFTHIAFHFPHVFGNSFREKYDQLNWRQNDAAFQRWCTGTTGFPIVDAGMRQLVQTGFMHNRVRMIVASFLTKDLHLDWRLGERFFANHLLDYDPAVNNGNWQWAASTGCDAQPYFRIFNPWSQQLKFDPQCLYIKQWVPELDALSPDSIHNLWKNFPVGLNYPRPMLEHAEAAKWAIAMFKKLD